MCVPRPKRAKRGAEVSGRDTMRRVACNRPGGFHALRASAHHRRAFHDRQDAGSAPRAHRHAARPGARAGLHALCARALLREAVPLLLLQPLSLPGGARPHPLQSTSGGDAASGGEGLRLRERVYRRRYAHGGYRRAMRDHRLRPRPVLHQGDQLRDEPEPSHSQLFGQAEGPYPAPFRGRAVLRQRASAPDATATTSTAAPRRYSSASGRRRRTSSR